RTCGLARPVAAGPGAGGPPRPGHRRADDRAARGAGGGVGALSPTRPGQPAGQARVGLHLRPAGRPLAPAAPRRAVDDLHVPLLHRWTRVARSSSVPQVLVGGGEVGDPVVVVGRSLLAPLAEDNTVGHSGRTAPGHADRTWARLSGRCDVQTCRTAARSVPRWCQSWTKTATVRAGTVSVPDPASHVESLTTWSEPPAWTGERERRAPVIPGSPWATVSSLALKTTTRPSRA